MIIIVCICKYMYLNRIQITVGQEALKLAAYVRYCYD